MEKSKAHSTKIGDPQYFEKFLTKELNTPQQQAVLQPTGAMIVVAGAGSGKTRVITARMANLILNEHVNPLSIIALTFTNKAAGEMKERLFKFLGPSAQLPFVGTFHAYCLLILRTNPSILPFPHFTIMDEDDQIALLKKIIRKNCLDKQISASQLSNQISKVKNQIKTDDDFFLNPLFKELFLAYETEKISSHCLDFDDLLISLLKIFQTNKDFKKKFQERIKHILVDEYQDTNFVQHELLKEMAISSEKKFILHSLCAVGDEDQSIYSWRGAMATNMISFQKDFAPVSLVKIEQNYRTVQPILEAANHLIQNNTQRHPKQLWSEKKAKNRILYLTCQSGSHEAESITAYLKTIPKKLHETAILYRTHFQSRSIEEALIRNSIPYSIIGGIRFYERKEIKDVLAYLRLIINPFDRSSLFRIINYPARGLGEKFEELLYAEWSNNPFLTFDQMLKHLLETQSLGNVKSAAIKQFLDIFAPLNKKERPSTLLSQILERTEYISSLRKTYDQNEAETKIENIQEFARSIDNFDKTLEDFLHEVALLQEKLQSNDHQHDRVHMMTLHSAKGLEFETVIITGLEEGLLPSSRSLQSFNALEEERRLFYVGMTRAKERLIITNALFRSTYGQILDQAPSRFVTEIPSNLLHHIDLVKVHPSSTKDLISQWQGIPAQAIQSTITTFSKPGAGVPAPSKPATNTYSTFKKKPEPKPTAPPKKLPWKKNQPVIHKKFGTGIIIKVEPADNDQYYLTINFKSGEKRIRSEFVQKA